MCVCVRARAVYWGRGGCCSNTAIITYKLEVGLRSIPIREPLCYILIKYMWCSSGWDGAIGWWGKRPPHA